MDALAEFVADHRPAVAAALAILFVLLPLLAAGASAASYPTAVKKSPFSLGTANANRDGSGTLATAITGGGPTVGESLSITFLVTTTQGMWRIYSSPDNGTTNNLIGEVPVPAWTPSATVPTLKLRWPIPEEHANLFTANDLIRCSIEKAESAKGEGSFTIFA